jgi:AAA+ ATPase superfamily predicted ATPase
MFVDRKKELQILEDEYKKSDFRFLVLYGRRRVGKTTLIKHFLEDKGIYLLATLENESLLIEKFKNIVADYFDDEFLKEIEIKSFEQLFKYIASKNQKLVIVIDEFQYLAKVNPAISSIFQTIIDNSLKDKNIFLILCGSIISLMYKETLSYSSPLYGRRTSNIKLKQLNFKYINEFVKQDIKTQIEIYSVLGGVPKYLEMFEYESSLFDSIEKYILDKDSFLYNEPYFLLQDEVNETLTYFSILEVIASGSHKIGEIAKKLQKPVTNITSFMKKLIDLEIVYKDIPVSENIKSKKGLYFIKDNFLRFWFSYVFPYKSQLEIGNIEFVRKKLEITFSEFVSKTYEDLAIEFVLNNFEVLKCGRWWNSNEEIDVVGISEEFTIFGECKWQNRKVTMKVLNDLVEKSKLIEAKNKKYILFSKSGFSEELIEYAKNREIFLVKLLTDVI